MPRECEAIYENGVLRPLQPIEGIPDHAKVRVVIIAEGQPHPLLRFAGTLPDEDAREILAILDREFGQVNPDDWK